MSDAVTINPDDAPVVNEKHGRGRPLGSKNKAKIPTTTSTLTMLVKRRRDRPLGSKNKKSSTTVVIASAALHAGSAQPIPSQISSASIFCFFAFSDTQCREHQCLPLKFAAFMDGREISEAILREASSEGLPY
jgi:hypothetical protein